MFERFFRNQKSDKEVEDMVFQEMLSIMRANDVGKTDFHWHLANKYGEAFLRKEAVKQGMASYFEMSRKTIEDFYFSQKEITFLFDLIYDLKTIPCDSFKIYINEWLVHSKLYKNKCKRISSVLLPDADIGEQFQTIQENLEELDTSMWIVINELMKAKEIYDKRDNYDMTNVEQVIERLSILEHCFLSNVSEKDIDNAKKAIVSYALNCSNSDYLEVYNKACINLLNTFVFAEKKESKVLPTVDVLISEAIIVSRGYSDIDLKPHIDTFSKEYGLVPELKNQFVLLNNVYRHLGLDITLKV